MAPDKPDTSGVETGCGLTIKRELGNKQSDKIHQSELIDNAQQNDVNIPCEMGSNVKQNQSGSGGDDDLTSLTWLHQQNLLKGLEIPSPTKSIKDENMNINNISNNNNNNISNVNTNSSTVNNNSSSNLGEDSAEFSENTNSISSLDDNYYFPESNGMKSNHQSSNKNYEKIHSFQDSTNVSFIGSQCNQPKISLNNINNNNYNNNNNNNNNNTSPVSNRNKHPTHIPYDPHLHKNSKPPYSFSCLIFMAIEDSPVKALPVKEVYAWILDHFPYFRNAPTGWKNSVRHNLSLNKCFRKVEKAPNLGKGSLWMVDDQYRPNLLQALSRAPFPPPTGQNQNTPEKLSKKTNISTRLPDPVLFPYLSKRLASSNITDNSEMEFDSDVDAAAAAMLSFKHGPIIINHAKSPDNRKRKLSEPETLVPIITRSSSEDHTYSCITSIKSEGMKSVKSSVDEMDADVDEQRKIAEGADALLNLAGIAFNHNNITNSHRHNLQTPTKTNTMLINHVIKSPTTTQVNSPKSKRRITSNDYSPLPDKRRKRWKEWADGNRYLKQVRG